jgi:hypothetical protein
MAKNLRLQDESKRATVLGAEKDGFTQDKLAELHESTERWRLVGPISASDSRALIWSLSVDASFNIRVDVCLGFPLMLPY